MLNPECPIWPGAAEVYSKAYRVLDTMAKRGHVTISGKGRKAQCHPSEDMRTLIDALNKGDEEQIKGLLAYRHIYF